MRAEPWLGEIRHGINRRFHSGVIVAQQLAASAMSPVAHFLTWPVQLTMTVPR